MKKALVLYTHIVGIAVIRALAKKGIPIVAVYYSPNEVGYLSRYVSERIKVSDPRSSKEDFINSIMALSSKYQGSLLIPTDDYTLIVLAENKDLLSKHYIVATESFDSVNKIVKKTYVYKISKSLGIATPKTFEPITIDQLKQLSNELQYPCLIKPLEGHIFYDIFNEKMFQIMDKNELVEQGVKLSDLGMKFMVQELIPGDDNQNFNYNSYRIDGEPVAEFTAQKVRIDPPFFGSPRVIYSKYIPELIEPGRLLLKELGYNGFSCMEFKRDSRDGKFYLMEINCRNNLSGALADYCGINFPWIQYRHLVYGEKEVPAHKKFKENIYWIDLTKDILMFFTTRKKEGYTIKEYLNPYLHQKVFAILSIKDPLPFLKRCYYIGTVPFRKLISALRTCYKKQKN